MGARAARAAIVLGILGATSVSAQEVKIQAPVTVREPRVITPDLLYETTRPRDEDAYADDTRVLYDPAFIRALSVPVETPTSTGRLGLSGWTSPNPPVGSEATGHREVSGWLGFGFSTTWSGPPPRRRETGPGDIQPVTAVDRPASP